MTITLRSGREFQKRKEEENEMTEKEDKIEAGNLTEEKIKSVVQQEHPVEEGKPQKKEEVRVYVPPLPFPQRLQKLKMDD